MPQEILNSILHDVAKGVRELFQDRLESAILFGSYARGDYDEESDIDIAVLADCRREDVGKYLGQLAPLATDIGLDYGKVVSFVCIPYADYKKWLPALPFYQNIEREGVKLSA